MTKTWLPLHKQDYTSIVIGQKKVSDTTHWYRYHTCFLPLGVVLITELHYRRPNDTLHSQTEFETVINSLRYRMTVNKVELSERSLKILAGKFIKEAMEF